MSFNAKEPFYFYTRQNLILLTGKKARNIKELLNGIKESGTASIYHHTHHYLEQYEFLTPEPPNDYAYWITNILQNRLLGEEIASLDIRQFTDLEQIKSRIINHIETSIELFPDLSTQNSPPGEEFHFKSVRTFVFPTKFTAHNLQDFADCLSKVSIYSIYYHVFESRLRKGAADFSMWLEYSLNEKELAKEFNKIDPYTHTLANLRNSLISLVEKELKEMKYAKA
jgi:hypothetical protein